MRKQALRLRVLAYAAEVEVVEGRGLRFVQGGVGPVDGFGVGGGGGGVPGDAQAVHVEEGVAHADEGVRGVGEVFVFVVGEEAGEIVLWILLVGACGGREGGAEWWHRNIVC